MPQHSQNTQYMVANTYLNAKLKNISVIAHFDFYPVKKTWKHLRKVRLEKLYIFANTTFKKKSSKDG